jgi:hypothetical protein
VIYSECDIESRGSCQEIINIEKAFTSFMDNILVAFKDKDCAKNWTRLETFFTMILDIVTSSVTAA